MGEGELGALGFANAGGRLELVVPMPVARWVQSSLADAIEEGPNPGVADSGARVATFVVALRAGMRAAWPLGALGEVGIEAYGPALA